MLDTQRLNDGTISQGLSFSSGTMVFPSLCMAVKAIDCRKQDSIVVSVDPGTYVATKVVGETDVHSTSELTQYSSSPIRSREESTRLSSRTASQARKVKSYFIAYSTVPISAKLIANLGLKSCVHSSFNPHACHAGSCCTRGLLAQGPPALAVVPCSCSA